MLCYGGLRFTHSLMSKIVADWLRLRSEGALDAMAYLADRICVFRHVDIPYTFRITPAM